MRKFITLLYAVLSLIFFIYLLIPDKEFPLASEKSMQSSEPADLESDLRRGYYNDETRSEVISYYKNKFDPLYFINIKLPIKSLRLNYPPEEAQTIIRDQTRSTYLEELVYPFRQSLYVNGFEPKKENDAIIVDGRKYQQKIIIKMVNSDISVRLLIGVAASIIFFVILNMWVGVLKKYLNKNYA